MPNQSIFVAVSVCLWGSFLFSQKAYPQVKQPTPVALTDTYAHTLETMPLYEGAIPNSIAGPNQEENYSVRGMRAIRKVSVPSVTVYLPAMIKSSHSAVVVFPGGAYEFLAWEYDGVRTAESLQDHGVAAILVKYRLPNSATMQYKSIGPLQDAQQALRLVREHAAEWNIDPDKVGVMGLSAGGHLAATVGTHFNKAYIPNPDNINLRPNFMVLVFPLVSMSKGLTHLGTRNNLLGENPSDSQVASFSNEQQVTDQTPPTLLLHATDDTLVDVENSIAFYEALHRHKISAEAIFFPSGGHGFFSMPRNEWMEPVFTWMLKNGWLKP